MTDSFPDLLLFGHDTVQCAYYLQAMERKKAGINFEQLAIQKETLRQSKTRDPALITLGNEEFLLQPYGSGSGYPFLITNRLFRIQMGEFMDPSFYVTFSSEGLWQLGAEGLHQRFMDWVSSVGFKAYKEEGLSRVDFAFDYHLPHMDFDEDSFLSQARKDSQFRENRQIQTFNYGKGDIVLRIYDKVAEIKQQSDKTWFFDLWHRKDQVWRIEWQIRKKVLRRFGIDKFSDLQDQQGDLLRYLANEHTTLRSANNDSNRSRWPLHPLWQQLIEAIDQLECTGIYREIDPARKLSVKNMQLAISAYGYLKRVAAVKALQQGKESVPFAEALQRFGHLLTHVHDPLTWQHDVKKRTEQMRLGHGH